MEFDLEQAMAVLSRTPEVLRRMLSGLDDGWVRGDEGPDSWSPFDIVGHLIHGEKTDWIPRARIILEHGAAVAFEPFDRFAQFEAERGRTLDELLDEFETLRRRSLEQLRELEPTPESLARTGLHPELGGVTLSQLLAAWTVHDLGHIAQVARVMAKQYGAAIGPWTAYLPVVRDRGNPI